MNRKTMKSRNERAAARRSKPRVSDEVHAGEPRLAISKYGYPVSGSHSPDDGHAMAKPLRGALARRTALTGRSGGAKKPTLAKMNLRPLEEDE